MSWKVKLWARWKPSRSLYKTYQHIRLHLIDQNSPESQNYSPNKNGCTVPKEFTNKNGRNQNQQKLTQKRKKSHQTDSEGKKCLSSKISKKWQLDNQPPQKKVNHQHVTIAKWMPMRCKTTEQKIAQIKYKEFCGDDFVPGYVTTIVASPQTPLIRNVCNSSALSTMHPRKILVLFGLCGWVQRKNAVPCQIIQRSLPPMRKIFLQWNRSGTTRWLILKQCFFLYQEALRISLG